MSKETSPQVNRFPYGYYYLYKSIDTIMPHVHLSWTFVYDNLQVITNTKLLFTLLYVDLDGQVMPSRIN